MEAGLSRALIFGTAYVEGQHARYVYQLWAALVKKLNPGVDVLVVDSASPNRPDIDGVEVLQLGDNIGHLSRTGRDGWGRAFCAGLEYAADHEYRLAVHIETDLLLAYPVDAMVQKMERSNIPAATVTACPHMFIETALMAFDLCRIDVRLLAGAYGWDRSPQRPFPEERIADILGNDLFCLPLRGCRNDLNQVTPRSLAKGVHGRMDWITHCADPAVYREFLRVNGCE